MTSSPNPTIVASPLTELWKNQSACSIAVSPCCSFVAIATDKCLVSLFAVKEKEEDEKKEEKSNDNNSNYEIQQLFSTKLTVNDYMCQVHFVNVPTSPGASSSSHSSPLSFENNNSDSKNDKKSDNLHVFATCKSGIFVIPCMKLLGDNSNNKEKQKDLVMGKDILRFASPSSKKPVLDANICVSADSQRILISSSGGRRLWQFSGGSSSSSSSSSSSKEEKEQDGLFMQYRLLGLGDEADAEDEEKAFKTNSISLNDQEAGEEKDIAEFTSSFCPCDHNLVVFGCSEPPYSKCPLRLVEIDEESIINTGCENNNKKPNHKIILLKGGDGEDTEEENIKKGHKDRVFSTCWSPHHYRDGLLYSGGLSGEVVAWKLSRFETTSTTTTRMPKMGKVKSVAPLWKIDSVGDAIYSLSFGSFESKTLAASTYHSGPKLIDAQEGKLWFDFATIKESGYSGRCALLSDNSKKKRSIKEHVPQKKKSLLLFSNLCHDVKLFSLDTLTYFRHKPLLLLRHKTDEKKSKIRAALEIYQIEVMVGYFL